MANRYSGRVDHSGRERSRIVWIIGVVLLSLAVLALVYVALTQNRAPAGAGESQPPTTTESPVERATPTEEVTPEPAAVVAVPARVMAAVDGQRAYRAIAGSCPGDEPIVEVTEDSGSSWSSFPVSVEPAAASVRSILPGDGNFVALVTADSATCAPQFARSYVAGAEWEAADEVDTTWHLSQDATSVVAPGGNPSNPCAKPVQVATTNDTTAAVLCADAAVVMTADAGGSWSAPVAIPGAAAIAAGGSGYLVVVSGQNGCAGAQLAQVPAAADGVSQPGACVASAASAPDNAVAQADDTVWLWSGDTVARSTDGGQTW